MSQTIAIEVGIDILPAQFGSQRTECEHTAGSVHHTFFYFLFDLNHKLNQTINSNSD
jgi:hypothetical protein